MRVVGVCPRDHPVSPGAVFAYRLGRIEDGRENVLHHTGETIPLGDFVSALADRARAELAEESRRLGCGAFEVRVETLVAHPEREDEAQWIPAHEYDPEVHVPLAGGQETVRHFTAVQEHEAANS